MAGYDVETEADRVGQAFIGALQIGDPVNEGILRKVVRLSEERLQSGHPQSKTEPESEPEPTPDLDEDQGMDWGNVDEMPAVVT